MPASRRAVRARLRTRFSQQRHDLAAAIHELEGSQMALHAAAGAIAAGLHADMLDADGTYELLRSVFDRQAHALAAIRTAAQTMGVKP